MLVKYVTRVYGESKPHVQISDEACLRPGCHDTRLLQGKVEFGKIVFDHTNHLTAQRRGEEAALRLLPRIQIVQGTHMTVTPTTCYLCHFKPAVEPGAEAPPNDCALCHRQDDLVGKGKARFDHAPVYAKGYACDKCHSQVIVGDGAVPRKTATSATSRRSAWTSTPTPCSSTTPTSPRTRSSAPVPPGHPAQDRQGRWRRSPTAGPATPAPTRPSRSSTPAGRRGDPHPVPNVMLEKGLSCKGCHVSTRRRAELVKSGYSSPARPASPATARASADILKNWEGLHREASGRSRPSTPPPRAQSQGRAAPAAAGARPLLEEAAFNIEAW